MNTHIQRMMKVPRGPAFTALAAFTAGSLAGYVLARPPVIPVSCLRAHFLERRLSFDVARVDAPLRAAAPEVSSAPAADPAPPVEPPAVPSASTASSAVSPVSSSSSSSSSTSADASSADSASSSASSVARSSASSAETVETAFPDFGHAVFPVARTPDWGAMKTPAAWNRSYEEMERSDFVRVPPYDMEVLTTPMKELLKNRDDPDTVRALTAKLFYSTRYFGTYDLDAGEFEGKHAGIDLKVPEGTPVGAIAGGRVSSVLRDASGLGLHVIIEHRLDGDAFYSVYGHLDAVAVREGQDVAPGETIAWSGSTGRSTSGHLHLQIDRGTPGDAAHEPYWPDDVPTRAEAARYTLHPVTFIEAHGAR